MEFPPGCARLVAASFAVSFSLATTDVAAVRAEYVNVDLISESGVLVPGKTAWLGLHLRHDPHWHSYWINPGDSGLPTRLKWDLPVGYTVDPVSWPAPSRFEVGGLYNFGYADEIVLPVSVHVPENAIPGQTARLAAEASWLVCREECITGKASFELELPIAATEAPTESSSASLFSAARKAMPVAAGWTGEAVLDGDRVRIQLSGMDLPEVEGLDVFAVDRRVLGNAPVDIRREGEGLVIRASKNDYFDQAPARLELVLTSRMTNGRSGAWQVDVPFVMQASSP